MAAADGAVSAGGRGGVQRGGEGSGKCIGRYVQRTVCAAGGMYSGRYVRRAVCTAGGMYSGRYVQRAVCTAGGMFGGRYVREGSEGGWHVLLIGTGDDGAN
ncbi:hypothetical protein [Paenibacillus sp. FSL R5-0912]|uniref:hypothetical protein n=1 Tax=Paenibacillus sp. FSL R5-0912 TaxID=1536771 RepID=UPI0004F8A375|nr:hypothetical protein [Paenibacillus sp. FSL R5-0912]AIQ42700.1 hypothetical protein R50912_23590 [Paenibacillus sp. FSL R5-0912]